MEQVLAAYQRPYDPAFPLVCFDESPQQLIGESRKSFLDSKGTKHVDYEYIREGVADIFMICEPLAGRREVQIEDNHNRFTYAKTLAYLVEDMYPRAKKITLIEDNLSAHKCSALYEVFAPERAAKIIQKLEIIRTPVHGSWLNIAECELSILARQALKERIPSREILEKTVEAWFLKRNQLTKKVNWRFTAKDARIKLKNLYPSFNC